MKSFNRTVFTVCVLFCPVLLYAHSGRTDSSGGHHDRKNGGYHFHNSGYSRSNSRPSSSTRRPSPRPSTPRTRPPSQSSTARGRSVLALPKTSYEVAPPKAVSVQVKPISITDEHWKTAFNNKVLNGKLGATASSGTVDILTDTHVIEVGKVSEFAEGILQVVKHAKATNKKPILALYMDGEQNGYALYQEAEERCTGIGVSLMLINSHVSVDDLIASAQISLPGASEAKRQRGVSDTPPVEIKNEDAPTQAAWQPQAKEPRSLKAVAEIPAITESVHLPYLRAPSLARLDRCPVVRVIDGDTIVVSVDDKAVTVRLIGVDTPETVHPSKPVEAYGKEASRFTRNLLKGEEVFLVHDTQGDRTDKYGRTLAYVYRAPDRLFVNADIIRQGYGHAYTSFPFEYMEEFKQLQLFAQQNRKGLWGEDVVVQEPLPLVRPRENVKPETVTQSSPTPVQATTQKQKPPTATRSESQSHNSAPRGNNEASSSQTGRETQKVTVYITRTGRKYHRGSCSYLRGSRIPISKADARGRGYSPCSRCSP